MTPLAPRTFLLPIAAVLLAALAPLARAAGPGPLELAAGAGYTRGVGPSAGAMPELQHLAGNGGALRLEAGWRVDPHWTLGCYNELATFAGGHRGTEGMTAVAAGLQAQLHLRPLATFDPWIGLGLGWRGLWLDHGSGTHVLQGMDLARVQIGVDHRLSRGVSVAPTVGVALTQLLSEKRPGASGYSDLEDRKVGAFLFAGVTGRLDVLGGDPSGR